MTEIYLGNPPANVKAWILSYYDQTPSEPSDDGPICFMANQAGSTVYLDTMAEGTPIAVFYEGDDNPLTLQYSTDECATWTLVDFTQVPADTAITLANAGDKVYFKAVNSNAHAAAGLTPPFNWKMTGSIAVYGNMQYFLDPLGLSHQTVSCCFQNMFYGCAALTRAPALPATALANNCYDSMFQDCINLTKAPALPAETLANRCYSGMFCNCTSLTQAPVLHATTLADYCCFTMFHSCTKLSSIEVNFTAWSPTNATSNWVGNVGTETSGTKTFICPAALPQTTGENNIPTGWTIVTK